jgi:hypothetical protein
MGSARGETLQHAVFKHAAADATAYVDQLQLAVLPREPQWAAPEVSCCKK